MPSLEKLHQEFKDDAFTMLAISIKEKEKTVNKHVREHGLTFPNLLDEDGSVSAAYGVSSTPMKFIIDKDGFIIGAALGFREWERAEVKSLIQELMNTSS